MYPRAFEPPLSKSLTDLTRELVLDWAEAGQVPDAVVDAAGPRLSRWLGFEPRALELETLTTDEPLRQIALEFPELFDGAFAFVVPEAWDACEAGDDGALLFEGETARQTIVLCPLERWTPQLAAFFENNDVEALWFRRRFGTGYVQWVWVTGGEDGAPWWVWSVNSGGDFVVVTKADAGDARAVGALLASAVATDPWRGWIEAARRQHDGEA